jgi:hypothetical protein
MNSISSIVGSQSFSLKNFIPHKYIDLLMADCLRIRDFDPVSTLHCFVLQILKNGSCKEALAAFNLCRLKNGLKLVSMNSAAFCKARKKLRQETLKQIALETGKSIEKEASAWKWKDRDVYLVDGTVLQLEDTKEIRSIYPITKARNIQQGQPKLRALGLFGLASGALLDCELGKYVGKGQAETTLFGKMLLRIKSDSIIVLDRFFTSFIIQEKILRSGNDYVIRARNLFAKKHLGRKNDVTVTIVKPLRSAYEGDFDYDEIVQQIDVRIIKSSIKRKGFRVAVTYIMTSFIDGKSYKKSDIEDLYLKRWNVELDIRNFKTTLGSSLLKTKTPEMILKEIWVRIICYNLIRKIIGLTSNYFNDHCPRKRSFKTAMSLYSNVVLGMGEKALIDVILLLKTEILNAKYRREPRAVKKRNSRYCLLTTDRKNAKKQEWGYSRRSGHQGLSKGKVA